jgi:ribosomal protein L18E
MLLGMAWEVPRLRPLGMRGASFQPAGRLANQEREMANKVDEMVKVLRDWQEIERQAMSFTSEISEKTDSTLIRMIMDIIRHDSHMHHRVQQYLIDTVTKESPAVTREDVVAIWGSIEEHDALEKKTIVLAEKLKKDAWSPVHKLLLEYLLRSEALHDSLLEQLSQFKSDMTRASGA